MLPDCPITGLPIKNQQETANGYLYEVDHGGISYFLAPSHEFIRWIKEEKFAKSLACGILANRLLPIGFQGFVMGNVHQMNHPRARCHLYSIENMYYDFGLPKTEIDRSDFILSLLYKKFESPDGSLRIGILNKFDSLQYFCSNISELNFFLQGFGKLDLLEISNGNDSHGILITAKPTIKGYRYLTEKRKESQKDLCFVAMSFGPGETPIFTEALKPAIEAAGYQARRVDDLDHHIDSEQTINDSILALAKNAHFVVCDYTGNKRGVYFEHGYAWGLGKKVIMTCKESEMRDLHFDVSHYSFIVWKDYEDLKKRLKDKIESWIGRYEKG
jgi:nucleoside 2-deoxyribosyltransferase